MERRAIRAAAELLWKCWERGERLAELPAERRPATIDEGYAVQAEVAARVCPRIRPR